MRQQNLDRSEVGSGFEQMRGEAVAQRVRMDVFAQTGACCCSPAGQPDDLGGDRMVGGFQRLPGNSHTFGFRLKERRCSRKASSSLGLSMMSRSLRLLPRWT